MKNTETQSTGQRTEESKESQAPAFDPVKLTQALLRIGEHSQKVMHDFIERHKKSDAQVSPEEIASISGAFMHMTQQWLQHPARMMEAGMNLWQDTLRLWQGTTLKMMGAHMPPVIEPSKSDRRFQDKSWSENAVFDFIKQSYLLSSRWMNNVVKGTEGLDEPSRMKVDFYTRQFVDAMSPSNFVLTNPEVLRATLESGGDNLVKGLENLLRDLEKSHGALKIAMTDEKAFEVGKNIATTPGKVIFQNELMQLIQYAPATAEVFEKPLLIIPPWINKFYILDLGQKKSMVRWLVSQGYTVFMISWVNPDESLKDKSFEDYMVDGPMAALAEIRKATGANEVNVVGYCIGGTLLACLLAYLESSPEEKARLPKISAATYFVTLLDFRDAGEISVFIDEENLKSMEEHMAAHGYFDGQTMAAAFNMLRANDLIWSFVVNNYLLGREPLPFDLLYWNADSTRMPAAMHSFYLREMYRKNSLAKPGGLQMKGVPIDLTKISTPAYFLSTREDHIAPWRSTYFGAQMMKGPVTFDLTSSGHIAGVVNPPAMSKYHHWINSKLAGTPEEWLKSSSPRDGSWWPSWEGWLRIYSGKKVPAREPGAGGATIIEDAPGSYVRVRAV